MAKPVYKKPVGRKSSSVKPGRSGARTDNRAPSFTERSRAREIQQRLDHDKLIMIAGEIQVVLFPVTGEEHDTREEENLILEVTQVWSKHGVGRPSVYIAGESHSNLSTSQVLKIAQLLENLGAEGHVSADEDAMARYGDSAVRVSVSVKRDNLHRGYSDEALAQAKAELAAKAKKD